MGLTDVLVEFSGLLVPLFFVGFVLFSVVSIWLGDRTVVRRTYLAALLAGLVVTNLFVPFVPYPMTHWNKFSEPRPAERTEHEVRVIDSDGDEIRFEEAAVLRADGGISPWYLTGWFVDDSRLSAAERAIAAQYVLDRANEYRLELANRSFVHLLRFPPHSGTVDRWTPELLAEYDRFVGLRVYRVELTTTADGTRLASYSETPVYEYFEDGNGRSTTVGRPSAPEMPVNATPMKRGEV